MFKHKRIVIGVAILSVVGAGAVFFIWRNRKTETQVQTSQKKPVYSCAMHPSITSDHPDKCPICQMDLQQVEDGPSSTTNRKIVFYRNPMRADVTSPTPMKDGMGMDYIPVYEDEVKNEGVQVQGRASFSLTPERQQLIGVTTSKVAKQRLLHEIRANGKVAFDPELFAAVEEYRQAILSGEQMKDSAYPSLREQADALLQSSRTKLKLMGLGDAQIRRLGSGKADSMNLLLPQGHVWIYAEVFEYEMADVKNGQTIEVTSPSVSGEKFTGKIASVSPVLNAATRTIRVRALVPDPKGVLRPDTFVNVKIQVDLGDKIVVPTDAVLHSGDQNFVFVVSENGKFEPRSVEVGSKTRELYAIESGLEVGETVATAANFLIDSESRLRGTLQNAKGAHP
ncbi:MAG: efflux RND transporter periplasmic adaptor subunit [Deltaproteobacteria bacterium]|nr:efflux RND transporter periplasmic adaptor subunit [Deltaproteobacteria bacterium]